MNRNSLTDATQDQYRPSIGRWRTLQLLLGMPFVFAAASIAGCADVRQVGSSRPKRHITGHGGATGKGR